MKWPTQLVIVRHAESQYNILKSKKSSDPLFSQFKKAYQRDYRSADARMLAATIKAKYSLGVSDAETALTSNGISMAQQTGVALKGVLGNLPDVVFVSPYHRTMETLENIYKGWVDLTSVKLVPDDRLREQEHGLSLIYNDWRVFHVFHPEQKELRDLQGTYWYQYPQGESVSQVRDRIRSFLTTLVREYSGQRVMLVTHHLTILSIRAILERLTPRDFIRLDEDQKPLNCGVTIYEGNPVAGKDGRLDLKQYNRRLY